MDKEVLFTGIASALFPALQELNKATSTRPGVASLI